MTRIRRAEWSARGLRGLVELAPELADLVAQPRGVFEAQLLGRGEHLLLELTIVFSISAGSISVRFSRRRRPLVGTLESDIRNSVMSEMPLTIVSGVIPCSSL